ncbi:MAG: hypothetical protein ACOC1G_00140 [Phycisphaeraceae bacterium]
MNDILLAFVLGLGVVLLGTAVLTALPRMGSVGRRMSDAFCRAPLLDAAMTWFIVVPIAAGPAVAGWLGLLAAIAGQLLGLMIWTGLHELAHPAVRRGPRIVKVLNRVLGTWRNHAALWVMLPAVPLFWLIRVAQMTVYPALVVIARLPRYRTGEWVNVSRHKFDGLVGHDLIWCLYCDWMTGLWSLGSEMLRNIESLWCPIRFDSQKKCENCRLDFPDVAGGSGETGDPKASWVPADTDIAAAAELLEQQYGNTDHRGWFGHQTRVNLTINKSGGADGGDNTPAES